MSSGDGRLQKSPDLSARPQKKIAKKKRAEMSKVLVSPALNNSA
jgi:hypothetical protein